MIGETEQQRDERFMRLALEEARIAAREGEVPVGAVVVANGKVVAKAHNQTERLTDVTAHAEILAITAAQTYFGGKSISDCTLYVTLEPCPMCAGAIGWARPARVVWGTSDPKRGYLSYYSPQRSPLHPKTVVANGVLEEECSAVMREFFSRLRLGISAR